MTQADLGGMDVGLGADAQAAPRWWPGYRRDSEYLATNETSQ
jgi:hypothetical protein